MPVSINMQPVNDVCWCRSNGPGAEGVAVDTDAPSPPRLSAPARHVGLLVEFANSVDTDEGTDDLITPDDLAGWLLEHDLLSVPADATSEDLDLALALRAGLKEAFADNHQRAGGDSRRDGALQAAAAELPLTLGGTTTHPQLRPVQQGVRGGLGLLLVAVQAAVADGTWKRLKICADDECGWAFFDASKNQSRNWCEWGCGNRAKTRNYRARRRAAAPDHRSAGTATDRPYVSGG
jgi:predicted RNA-binding Zn ribbon-like protein